MTLRPRRQAMSLDEFEDPLSNYEPVTYADDLERVLSEDKVRDMKITPFKTVDQKATVHQVLNVMIELDVACVLVTDGDRLAGIFSERDVLSKVAENYDQVKDQAVSQFMTAEPVVIYDTDSPAKALNVMALGGFRHVPILDVDGKIVGILGPRRVTRYLQAMFRQQGM